jgi:hypothetical protein
MKKARKPGTVWIKVIVAQRYGMNSLAVPSRILTGRLRPSNSSMVTGRAACRLARTIWLSLAASPLS